jgi:hypothetical protein
MSKTFWRLILIPSFYGLNVWLILILMLSTGVLYVKVSVAAYFIYFYVLVCLIISLTKSYFSIRSRDIAAIYINKKFSKWDRVTFFSSTAIGFIGFYFYIKDFSGSVGGLSEFFLILVANPIHIRAIAEEQTSIGFQLSYFSWISIGYCAVLLFSARCNALKTECSLIFLLGVQFILNMLFIDRTRPVILFLSIGLIYLLTKYDSIKRSLGVLGAMSMFPLGFFLLHGSITGKYDQDQGLIFEMLAYVLGGFGYFSELMRLGIPDDGLYRTFYPLAKLIQSLGFSIVVPSQIPEFYAVPFETNAGTFLEPLYSDGGILVVIVGVPLIIFINDYLASIAARLRSCLGVIIWAHMIIVMLFSFFVPKFNSTHVYLFVLMLLVSRLRYK